MTQRLNNIIYFNILFIILLIPFTKESLAQNEPWGATADELKSMPPLCTGKANEGSPENKYWKNILGEDFQHVHHYCRGLVLITRSYKKGDKKERMDTLLEAVREFDYMLLHSKPGFSLMPEIHFNRGLALDLRKDPSAIAAFSKAIELNSHLTQAYSALANIYTSNGNRNKALEIISTGLKTNPGIKSLQRKYLELGGREPIPSPVDVAASKSENEPKLNESKTLTHPHQLSTINSNASGSPSPQQVTEKTTAPTLTETTQPREAISQPPGNTTNPNNPYCRFCPN